MHSLMSVGFLRYLFDEWLFTWIFVCCNLMMFYDVWWMYLAPQNIPSAIVLTLGNNVVLYYKFKYEMYMPRAHLRKGTLRPTIIIFNTCTHIIAHIHWWWEIAAAVTCSKLHSFECWNQTQCAVNIVPHSGQIRSLQEKRDGLGAQQRTVCLSENTSSLTAHHKLPWLFMTVIG